LKAQNILILIIILLFVGGIYYFSDVPEPVEKPDPKTYVWMIDMEDITHVTLEMPREDMSESFIRSDEKDVFPWYFDDESRSPINVDRWGGGVTLLLSGPGADRIIAKDASPEKLAEFGLDEPSLIITLSLENGKVITIDIGDAAPNGITYYVKAPNTSDVALVDYTWYNILEGLVKDPPYAVPKEEE
jgi:hypothetical protein